MTAPPLTLAIETSNPSAGTPSVVLGRIADDETLVVMGIEALRVSDRRADDLMGAIDRLCAHTGVRPAEIDRIGVSVGPGGYTALRIAVATAALLAEACGAEVVAVPTPAVVAESITPERLPALICLASKKGSTHATLFDSDGLHPIGVVDESVLQTHPVRTIVGDAHLPDAFRTQSVVVIEPVLSGEACLALAVRLDQIAPEQLRPVYAREPDAVTQWRARHG